MLVSCGIRRAVALVSTAVLALALCATVSAAGDSQSAGVVRPSTTIVKRAFVKFWDTDAENSVDEITLRFRALKLLPTRRAVPERDFVESTKWITPVVAVFDQRTVRTSEDILNGGTIRSCFVYRVSFTGIFWKGDFGWTFKNRDVKTMRISSVYRC